MRRISLLIKFIIVVLVLFSCGPKSTKGKWTKFDKESLRKDIENSNVLDKYSNDIKDKYINCCLQKCEESFSSYIEANSNEYKSKQILDECSKEVFSNGSIKGKWSKIDKDKFRLEMNKVEELNNLGDLKNRWIECFLSKSESEFSSYFEGSNEIEKTKEISQECSREILNK